MSVGFVFRFTPFRLAGLACVIYLALVGVYWLAVVLAAHARGIGFWGLSATRLGWTILNALLFLVAFALSWQIVGPKVR
jgi:hypothetical protein